MESISAKKARDQLSDVLNKVAYTGERFTLTRHGQGVAVLISLKEWEQVKKILELIEDEQDLADAKEALAEAEEKGTISLEQLKKELDLDV